MTILFIISRNSGEIPKDAHRSNPLHIFEPLFPPENPNTKFNGDERLPIIGQSAPALTKNMNIEFTIETKQHR